MRNLFEDIAYRYFNYDNKFLRTFRHLFSKPEVVIESYINGTRKKYVDVISYFTIAITLTGLYVYVMTNFYPEAMTSDNFLSAYTAPGSKEIQEQQINIMTKYTSLMMMSFIPLYALIAKIVFFNKKKFNFTELVVIFLYTQAQMSIITSIITITILVLGIDIMIFSLTFSLLMLVYFAYCLKRLYKISIADIMLRSMGCAFVFVGLIVIMTLGFVAWMFLTEAGQEFGEAQKATAEALK